MLVKTFTNDIHTNFYIYFNKKLPLQYLSDTAPSMNVILPSGQTSQDVE